MTVAAGSVPEPAALVDRFRKSISDSDVIRRSGVVVAAYAASLVVFGIVVVARGADPAGVFSNLVSTSLFQDGSIHQVLLRAVPISLAALAVTVPARAGLVNVGGEGQLIVGAVAATGIGVAVGHSVAGPVSWLLMAVAGAGAGALWGGLAGILRTALGANEAVTTLLLNFVANDVMLYLIYQSWKDPHGSGQPQSRPLAHGAQLPDLTSWLSLGVVIAAVLCVATWYLLRRTGWGFGWKVVGGNTEAAHRAGLPVNRYLLTSMVVGGALAGLGGMLNLAGTEFQLRPGITATFGYVAFLASWLGRHDPVKVVAASLLFSVIALGGNGLQLNFGLDGAVVDVLLGLIVVAPLVLAKSRREALS